VCPLLTAALGITVIAHIARPILIHYKVK